MPPPITRRRFLALTTAGVLPLAGCQSTVFSDSEAPVRITVTNATEEKREIWIQLTREDASDPIGESVLLGVQSTTVLERTVPTDTYRLTASVDDPRPSLKKRAQWQVTERSCSTTGVITLTDREGTPDLLVNTASCDEA